MLAIPEAASYTSSRSPDLKVLWGWVGGLGSGWLMGMAVGQLVLYLRREFQMALGMEEFLTLGMIASSFGVADLIGAVGFIAGFCCCVAVRHLEFTTSGRNSPL